MLIQICLVKRELRTTKSPVYCVSGQNENNSVEEQGSAAWKLSGVSCVSHNGVRYSETYLYIFFGPFDPINTILYYNDELLSG